MYGIYITYLNGYRERLGVTRMNKKGSRHVRVYASFESEEAAQRCADLLTSKENGIKKAIVKPCKK